jgi:hypothetical protein
VPASGRMRDLCSSRHLTLSIADMRECVTGWGSCATGILPVKECMAKLAMAQGRATGVPARARAWPGWPWHKRRVMGILPLLSPRWASKEGLEWLWRLGSPSPGYLENLETRVSLFTSALKTLGSSLIPIDARMDCFFRDIFHPIAYMASNRTMAINLR